VARSDTEELVRRVRRDLLDAAARGAAKRLPALLGAVRAAVSAALAANRFFVALTGDEAVRAALGVPDPRAAAGGVIAAVAAAVTAAVTRDGDDVVVTVSAFRRDFSDALAAASASYVSVGKFRQTTIKWLELVLFGEYEALSARFGLFHGARPIAASRTGRAVMYPLGRNRRSGRGSGGRPFRVPAAAAGTREHNWLTEAAAAAAAGVTRALETFADDVVRELNR
jgi:hypothetical protein